MCVIGAQEGEVLTLSIKQHVFNFHGRTVETHGRRGPEEERSQAWLFLRSGHILSGFSHCLPEMPFSGSLIVSDS